MMCWASSNGERIGMISRLEMKEKSERDGDLSCKPQDRYYVGG
jgi:hypothetical protein